MVHSTFTAKHFSPRTPKGYVTNLTQVGPNASDWRHNTTLYRSGSRRDQVLLTERRGGHCHQLAAECNFRITV